MKKANRKLIPAVAMLLVSAIMLSTASFAWFSMNTTVTAKGMKIQAKSDSAFLLIGTSSDVATLQSENKAEVNFNMSGLTTEVFPVAHDAVTNTADADTVGKWYTMVAASAAASTGKPESKQELSEALTGYVIHQTVYVTLAKGSNEVDDLVVKNVKITGIDGASVTPVNVLITSATAQDEFGSEKASSNTVLHAKVNDTTAKQVDIYIYYDGNDSAVYTNNVANLGGATIEVKLGVTQPDGAVITPTQGG